MSINTGPGSSTAVEQQIGPEIRRLREGIGLSLRTLAERSGFSPSFISQVEHGQASPSIASLARIAAALDRTLSDFFGPAAPAQATVVRADSRPSFRSSWSKARVDALTPLAAGFALEATMVTLEPGGSSGRHEAGVATDQLGIVIRGHVTLQLGDDTTDLGPGDAVQIRARQPHRWQNRRSSAAEILLVSSRGPR